MRCACVDIGSNTVRLLVADVVGALPREVLTRKAHTDLGRALRGGGGARAVERLLPVVAQMAAAARDAGVAPQRLRVVATAALRGVPGTGAIAAALAGAAGTAVEVLSGEQEARLAFLGATRTCPDGPVVGTLAVVDVGGGSTELAIGAPGGEPSCTASVPVGSSTLAEQALRSDPPRADELQAARLRAAAALDGLDLPPVGRALAVGGSAASLSRIAGPRLDASSVAVAIARLAEGPAVEVAAATGLAAERVRLLPAGLLLLAAAADRLGRPLELGCGGLREGVCLELAAGGPGTAPAFPTE